MHHIKNDKRSQTSAQLITNGLFKCLEQKSFSQITISDVQRESSVGRATFYRLFDNLPDVLSYQCDKVFSEVMQHMEELSNQSTETAFVFFVEHWIKHQTLLETIVTCNRLDILQESHRKNTGKFKPFLSPELNLDEAQMDYLLAILTSTMASTLSTWVLHGKKETAQQLFQNINKVSQVFYRIMNQTKL